MGKKTESSGGSHC